MSLSETAVAIQNIVRASNSFGFALLQQLAATNPGNVVISPFSLSAALTMIGNGAGGTTRQTIFNSLGLSGAPLPALNAAYSSLIQMYSSTSPSCMFNVSNSLWLGLPLALDPVFSQQIASRYFADVRNIDFTSPEAATALNLWLAQRTNGKITDSIRQLDANSAAVLLNAVYFKASWQNKFSEQSTVPGTFLQSTGAVNVPMMSQDNRFGFCPAEQFDAVSLPYQGPVRMSLVVPNTADLPLDALAAGISMEIWDQIRDYLATQLQYGRVALPKFNVKSHVSLNDGLQRAGLSEAFDPSRADFSALTATRPAFLSRVEHSACVSVDENGTESAPFQGAPAAGAAPLEFEMKVDKPFLLVIEDAQTGAFLFLGIIRNVVDGAAPRTAPDTTQLQQPQHFAGASAPSNGGGNSPAPAQPYAASAFENLPPQQSMDLVDIEQSEETGEFPSFNESPQTASPFENLPPQQSMDLVDIEQSEETGEFPAYSDSPGLGGFSSPAANQFPPQAPAPAQPAAGQWPTAQPAAMPSAANPTANPSPNPNLNPHPNPNPNSMPTEPHAMPTQPPPASTFSASAIMPAADSPAEQPFGERPDAFADIFGSSAPAHPPMPAQAPQPARPADDWAQTGDQPKQPSPPAPPSSDAWMSPQPSTGSDWVQQPLTAGLLGSASTPTPPSGNTPTPPSGNTPTPPSGTPTPAPDQDWAPQGDWGGDPQDGDWLEPGEARPKASEWEAPKPAAPPVADIPQQPVPSDWASPGPAPATPSSADWASPAAPAPPAPTPAPAPAQTLAADWAAPEAATPAAPSDWGQPPQQSAAQQSTASGNWKKIDSDQMVPNPPLLDKAPPPMHSSQSGSQPEQTAGAAAGSGYDLSALHSIPTPAATGTASGAFNPSDLDSIRSPQVDESKPKPSIHELNAIPTPKATTEKPKISTASGEWSKVASSAEGEQLVQGFTTKTDPTIARERRDSLKSLRGGGPAPGEAAPSEGFFAGIMNFFAKLFGKKD